MAKAPFMPLYTSDYLGDTGHLSTEEHGAYLLILMQMWNAGGTLPSEARKLARVARCSTKKWLSMADTILAFFDDDGDEISSARLSKERQKVEAKTEVRRAAGAKGGAAKALKTKKSAVANATAKPCHSPEPYISTTGVVDTSEDLTEAFEAYQKVAKRLKADNGDQKVWPLVEKFTPARRARLKARIKEHGLPAWGTVLRKASASAFCTGSSGWVADFDFLTSQSGFIKTLEGNYDDRAPNNPGPGKHGSGGNRGHAKGDTSFAGVAASMEGYASEPADPAWSDGNTIDGEFAYASADAGPGKPHGSRGDHRADARPLLAGGQRRAG